MSSPMIISFSGNEIMGKNLSDLLNVEIGETIIRHFPDGETYVKIISDVKGRDIILVCSLQYPNDKFLPIYFLSKTLKEFGASSITLVAPYLPYMRQDKRFSEGECITSVYFAELLSSIVDKIITIDPHLHRRKSLNEIYNIPTVVLHAAKTIAAWIRINIPDALLVGPDIESEQWVSVVAKDSGVPYIVLKKIRYGDKDVEIKVPDVSQWKLHIPVLIDDIISTARTMTETVVQLHKYGYKAPICIGVHGVFSSNAYAELLASGVDRIVTTNSIPHPTNCISITELIAKEL